MNTKRKFDGMLVATFITTLFYSSTYPYIHKEIISSVSDAFISLEQIVNCLGIIYSGLLWNKFSNKIFRFYPLFCVLESILGVFTSVFAITTHNLAVYYMVDTIIFAVVTRNICCGGVKLRALRYNSEEKREKYDNNNNSLAALATIIGSTISIFLNLNFEIMLCIATVGNMVDNIFYIFIYYNEKKNKEA